jgi:hypothetical protein
VVAVPTHSTTQATMKKKISTPSFLTEAHEYVGKVEEFLTHIKCDNLENAKRKFDSLLAEIEKARALKQEWKDITNTSDIGLAKKRTRSLMKVKFEGEESTIPEIYLVAPFHWISGKPQTAKFPQGLPPMLPSKAERFLRREVWPYLRDLVAKLHLYTEIEKVRILEDLEEQFYSESPKTFSESVIKYLHNIEEREDEEEYEQCVPLANMLNLCVGYYPDTLLTDCRERGEEAGYVSKSWMENLDSKYTTATTAEAREDVARLVLVRFIYRVSGGEGIPLPEQETNIARRLSTERWNPFGPDWIVTDKTRLDDLLEPLTIFQK